MSRLHCGDVWTVEGHDDLRSEPFSERDDRSVRAPEREVLIELDELGDPLPFLCCRRFDLELLEPAVTA
jgi:hypothetical protein